MTGEGKARITVVFLALFFMLLDILSAILLPVRRNGSERRMKWSGFCFLVFFIYFFLFPLPPTSSLCRLYFRGGPGVRGKQSRLGRHDSTFRPIPPFVRHTAAVLMELVSERSYSVRERKAERQRKRVAGSERGKCEVLLLRCPGKSGCIGSV